MLSINRIISLLLFLFVFIVYVITMPKTISFWDSAEFITSSYTLQASHPPGAPFYTLLCKVILSFFPASKAALVSNVVSGFFGALTVVFLYNITAHIAKRVLILKSSKAAFIPQACGLISGLSLAFSDSFWTAATETEVYTLSFAILTGMVYIMLLWENAESVRKEFRLLLLFSFVLGIATGVHLITIAAVIPFALIIAHKKFGLTVKTFIISLILGTITFFCIYVFLVQGTIKITHIFDVFLVNTWRLPLNSGIILFLLLFAGMVSWLLYFSFKRKRHTLHHIMLCVLFFFVGMSAFFMSLQRADANMLVTNSVENSNRMLQYIRAEQFGVGSIPLVKGPVYNAPLDKDVPFVDGKPMVTYDEAKKKYVTVHDGKYKEVHYADEFTMWFPRMFDKGDSNKYNAWTTITGENIKYPVKGEVVTIAKPTFSENLGFFYNYQVMWLNARYLFWNFIGRQNDYQGIGHVKNGNWVSGFEAIDKHRIGEQAVIPERYKNHPHNDVYYFLPFLLGICGLIALWKHPHYFWTTLLLFLTFGIGITIYVNPVPSSILIRERDYIFIGSFIFFALWIGLSFLLFIRLFSFVKNTTYRTIVASIIISCLVPLQLLAKGWDNHQRSHDRFPYQFAKGYLDACPEQAVLITNGDNMTFPLWYLQQVEGYRTDVRVLNFDQLNTDTHIQNLQKASLASKPLQFTLSKELYRNGMEKLFPLQEEIKEPAILPVLFEFLHNETTRIEWNGRLRHYIPSTSFSIPIDTLAFRSKYNPETLKASFTNTITWEYPKKFYGLNDIVLMNLITNNISERPICFAINGKKGHLLGLEKYFIQHGMVQLLAPIQRSNPALNPKIVATEMMYPYMTQQLTFDGFGDAKRFIKSENKVYVQEILRRNYYFLTQALLEENQREKAIEVLDTCTELFPNEAVSYRQYAYAVGKLYIRAGKTEKGIQICKTAMRNLWQELQWMTSFDPPNPVINLRHAYQLKNMYAQMRLQFPGAPNDMEINDERFRQFEAHFQEWQQKNWPY